MFFFSREVFKSSLHSCCTKNESSTAGLSFAFMYVTSADFAEIILTTFHFYWHYGFNTVQAKP